MAGKLRHEQLAPTTSSAATTPSPDNSLAPKGSLSLVEDLDDSVPIAEHVEEPLESPVAGGDEKSIGA